MDQDTALPLMPLNELIGNPPAHYNALQQLLLPHTDALVIGWWFVWIITAAYLIRFVFRHGSKCSDGDRELYTE
jgi:hypothetical protein